MTIDPRLSGFNYAQGWGNSPKPPLYHQAMSICRALNERIVQLSAQAWQLEMKIRDVRLASSAPEKCRELQALAEEIAPFLVEK